MMMARLRPNLPRAAGLIAVVGLAMLVPSAGASAATGGRAPASASGCQVVADPPTDYFGIVVPMTEVRCASTQTRIHVEVTLERDGSAVAFAARDCHKASSCILSVDASFEDAPGNQVWCTDAAGQVRSEDLGQAVACEDQEF